MYMEKLVGVILKEASSYLIIPKKQGKRSYALEFRIHPEPPDTS
jgi:hypothetical protein